MLQLFLLVEWEKDFQSNSETVQGWEKQERGYIMGSSMESLKEKKAG